MKTIEIKLYKFDELSEDAQKYAIDKWIKSELEFGDPLNFFEEYCADQVQQAGFYDCQFQWSLSSSQGDGLSFSGKFNTEKLTELFLKELGSGKEKTAKLLAENCTVVLTGNKGHYSYAHENQVDLYLEPYTSSINTDTANIDDVVLTVKSKLADLYLLVCKELETSGYKEIDYYYSEENAKESIMLNDYDFTEDGKIY